MDYFNLNTPIKFGETEEDRERKRLQDKADFELLMKFKEGYVDDEDNPHQEYEADRDDALEQY